WVGRRDARYALAQFDLNEDEQTLVLDAIRKMVDVSKVAAWCTGTFGRVSDDYQAHHIRRYVAAKCAHTALSDYEEVVGKLIGGDINLHCLAKYKEWSDPNRRPTASPHYEATVAPMLSRLREIARSDLATRWEDQLGDHEIELIFDQWRAVRGQ